MSFTQTQTIAQPSERLKALQTGISAMMLGAFVVFVVGFSWPQAIHDAAHDMRHANIAPCH